MGDEGARVDGFGIEGVLRRTSYSFWRFSAMGMIRLYFSLRDCEIPT